MRAKRLSRKDTQAQTRARLLASAAKVFAERGFYGAAIDEIVSRAGFTRGAFFSNFADKEDIFLAVLDQQAATDIAEVAQLVTSATTPDGLFSALRARYEPGRVDDVWLALWAEFRLHAIRTPSVRPRLAERERALRVSYGCAVVEQYEALGVQPPLPPELMGAVVEALDSGLKVQRIVDPDSIPEQFFVDVLVLLLSATAAADTTPRRPRRTRRHAP